MIIDGKWELRALLGEGAFGKVFEAWHLKLDHPAAIKVLVDGRGAIAVRQRFLEEAQLMAGLSSEHLVRASDYGELPDGSPYFVMDLVKGKSLRSCLVERPSVLRAVAIAEEVLEGLVEVHKRGVVHGDIKPENIVVGQDGKVRLLDFGLAQTTATEGEELGGTPHYMAPEMLLRGAPASARTDVYAVGVVLYEMLTGRLPRGHLGMEVGKLRAAWASKPKPSPVLMFCQDVAPDQREALEALDKLVMEALASDPSLRPKSAQPVLTELQRLRKRLVPEALASTAPPRSQEARPVTEVRTTRPFDQLASARPRWLWPAVAGAVVVLAVVGWVLWPESPEPARSEPERPEPERPEPESETPKRFVVEDIEKARGGILVALREGASGATKDGYEVLCQELGDGAVDAVPPVICHRGVLLGVDELLDLAKRAEVVAVVVGDEEAEELGVHAISQELGNPLVAQLDGLPLPRNVEEMRQVAPVLKAAMGRTDASELEIPVLDEGLGPRWGALAELFRSHQGHNGREDMARRSKLMADLAGDERHRFHRDLAELTWARAAPASSVEDMLRALSDRSGTEPWVRMTALLALATMFVDGEDVSRDRADEAEAALVKALDLSLHVGDPCVAVSALGTASRIDWVREDDAVWRMISKRLPSMGTCERTMTARSYAARGRALAQAERWCDAAMAFQISYTTLPSRLESLLDWAEYQWSCDSEREGGEAKGRTERADVLEHLGGALPHSQDLEHPQQCVSIAYLRWWIGREPADRERLLECYDRLEPGEVGLIEGVASTLAPAICGGPVKASCSYAILTRPKDGGSTEALRAGLGLR